ncbi:MAG: VWA domain-containing protein [Roseiflexaceae bacterium]
MTFLLPIGLLALLSLPVIVILHLIRERRRRVAVPSLLHWRTLPRTRAGERPRTLPVTLLLLLHLLIAGLLGLALAQPQILSAFSTRVDQTAIVLDLSTSMAASDGGATRFDEARDRARALLRSLGSGGQATLIAAGPRARVIASGSAGDLPLLEAALDGLRPGGTGAAMDEALTLAAGALDPQKPGRIVVLTDGSLPTPATRTLPAEVDWQTVGGDAANRAVVTFAARPLGTTLQVYARVANYASAPFSGQLRIYGDEQLLDTRTVAIDPEREAEQTWRLSAGPRTLRVELDGGDALAADDTARLSVGGPRQLRVALVSDTPDTLRRALEAVPGVTVEPVGTAAYAAGRAADLTVFEGFLPESWPNSAVLAVNPPEGSALIQVGGQTRAVDSGELTLRSELLAGLSFGGVEFGPVPTVTPPAWAETLLSDAATPLIMRGRDGDRPVVVWAFDLERSNLRTRLAFPLLVARTVRDLAPAPLPDAIQAGAPLILRPAARTTSIQLTTPDGQNSTTPAAPALTLDSLTQPGWYRVVEQTTGGALFDGRVAVNAGSPLESDLRPQTPPQLTADAQGEASSQRRVLELWPWLALGALVVLGLEWLYTHWQRTQ